MPIFFMTCCGTRVLTVPSAPSCSAARCAFGMTNCFASLYITEASSFGIRS